MRIERVDDKTVKCFISNEELEEYDIDYKDFIMRSDKAKEVVQEIIEQAAEEVGYKPPKFAFDLQIMMMPDQGLVLTLSEKDPSDYKEGEQILQCLKDMKQMLENTREKIGVAAENIKKGKAKPAERPEEAVFVFEGIGSLMEYAKVIPTNLRVRSALYSMDGKYYLHLCKGSASYERYSKACVQAIEFAYLYSAEADRLLHLREHGECLIEEQALKKLK